MNGVRRNVRLLDASVQMRASSRLPPAIMVNAMAEARLKVKKGRIEELKMEREGLLQRVKVRIQDATVNEEVDEIVEAMEGVYIYPEICQMALYHNWSKFLWRINVLCPMIPFVAIAPCK